MTQDDKKLRSDLDRQRRLAEASYALHTTLDLGELLQLILKSASEGVDADRGTVFLVGDDHESIWSRIVQGDEALEIRLPMGKGIAGTVAETGKTIRIADAYDDVRFDQSWDKKSGYRTRQILCAPIMNRRQEVVGLFQLLNHKGEGDFDGADEDFLSALSIHAALAIENAQLHHSSLEKERQDREIALVQNVQRAIQPETREVETDVLEVAGRNILCEHASGDYYDIVELPDGRVLVLIGDVSGHGLQAALVMAQARAFLHARLDNVSTPDQILNRLNEFLARDLTSGRFMTFFLALIDVSGHMTWASAGHLPTYHRLAATGDLVPLMATGPVLGVVGSAVYGAGKPVHLQPGDTLTLYTDGVTEAVSPDGDMFRDERLEALLRERGGDAPVAVLDAIHDALRAFTGGKDVGDDLTSVCVRRRLG